MNKEARKRNISDTNVHSKVIHELERLLLKNVLSYIDEE